MNYFELDALTAPLSSTQGLTHAVLQSIFNQRLATKNDIARMGNGDNSGSIGGCWSEGFVLGVGSRDWTLQREKLTDQTRIRTARFIEEALAWLVSDGIVKSVTVSVTQLSPTTLARLVLLTCNDDAILKVDV
ncbi:hypothetical protein JI57_03940 [Psychromonas sp. PRT-SC03]|nr:hypothetical protein JI57_03940 [Psychromonas sp. PRT-SC03]